MKRNIVLFLTFFLVSIITLVVFNDNCSSNDLSDMKLRSELSVNPDKIFQIDLIYRDIEVLGMNEDEAKEYHESKLRIVRSLVLTETIEVYSMDVYSGITEDSSFIVDDNGLSIISDFGPISFYKGSTFLTYGQFNPSYFDRVPNRIYEIHIPMDLEYNLN